MSFFLARFGRALAPFNPWSPISRESDWHDCEVQEEKVERLVPEDKDEVTISFGSKGELKYHADTYMSYAEDGDIHVLLLGEVASWPGGIDVVKSNHDAFMCNQTPVEPNDAHWLLEFVRTFDAPGTRSDEVLDKALECLEQVRGSFAFVIYDKAKHRVLAARDRDGVIPLYWGTDLKDQLLFSSRLSDLSDCTPSATLFPAGSLFASSPKRAVSPGNRGWVISGEGMPGELLSFIPAEEDRFHYRGIKAIPRITSKGVLCGAIYKVASKGDLGRPVMHF